MGDHKANGAVANGVAASNGLDARQVSRRSDWQLYMEMGEFSVVVVLETVQLLRGLSDCIPISGLRLGSIPNLS
jgi:hypothetical protein